MHYLEGMWGFLRDVVVGLMLFCVILFALLLIFEPILGETKSERIDLILQQQEQMNEMLLQILIYVEEP